MVNDGNRMFYFCSTCDQPCQQIASAPYKCSACEKILLRVTERQVKAKFPKLVRQASENEPEELVEEYFQSGLMENIGEIRAKFREGGNAAVSDFIIDADGRVIKKNASSVIKTLFMIL
jgi:hypothetical protein